MRTILMLGAFVLLAGCPEPVPAPGPSGEGAPPVDAAPPPEGGGAAPAPVAQVEPGTGVVISGTFTYEGEAKGTYRLDVSAPQTGGPPVMLAQTTLPALGPWSVEVPKNAGAIMIVGFIEEGHGPGGGSPTATVYGLTVAETPLADVVVAPAVGGAITGTPPGPAPGDGGAGADPSAAPVDPMAAPVDPMAAPASAAGGAAPTPGGAAPAAAGAPPAPGAPAPGGAAPAATPGATAPTK